jgi:hypothetical protein
MSAPTAPTLTYGLVRDYLSACLDQAGIPQPEFNPGPPSYEGVADTPNAAVVVTVGGGPGRELEDLYDRVFLNLDVAGGQSDYDSAESLALAVDRALLAVTTPRLIGGLRFLAIRQAGGRPTPVGVDDGDRWHLVCSYVARVQSAY